MHFLATSNIAEPLEMLHYIVDQIWYVSLIDLYIYSLHSCSYGQRYGIRAWDCALEETVVLIPSVLALLGDNPMQSKFTSHIRMNGNLFCQVCLVKNPTLAEDEVVEPKGTSQDVQSGSDAGELSHESDGLSDLDRDDGYADQL